MKQLSNVLILALLLVLGTVACKTDPERPATPPAVTTEPVVKTQVPVPAFDADSAYAHVAAQVGHGPRTAGSAGHGRTRAYIQQALERYGARVTVQDFTTKFYDGERATGYNIVGSFNPEAKRRIFLSAHYDTRPIADSELADPARRNEPILGADDGASGVGVLLEMARLLGRQPHGIDDFGVDLVFFDLEDNGNPDGKANPQEAVYSWGLGSQHWARQPHVDGYSARFGVLLDMVGAEGAVFGKEAYSREFAGDVQTRIWNLARQMNRGDRFIEANIGYTTDDHYFVNTIARIPTVDIIYKPVGSQRGFGDHWHTHNDKLDIISRETLGDVGQVVTAAVYREAGNML